MEKIWGYVRTSTPKQNPERQIYNIHRVYPEAEIISEAYTGTKMDRPKWNALMKKAQHNDTIVFDEISRMSRNAEEGFATYKELYNKGVKLVFLKESTLNTENYKKTAQVAMTGSDVDIILDAVNKYLMILAENQIKSAFATSQHEVDFLHKRTREGIRRAQDNGKRIGTEPGRKLVTQKSIKAKKEIRKYCKDFEGSLNDKDTKKLVGISNNTYYKYKRELKEEMAQV